MTAASGAFALHPYRRYALPWTPSEAEERRVRRILGAALGLFIGFGVVIPLLPQRAKEIAPPPVPERIVEFLLEQPKPVVEPPPPPPPPTRIEQVLEEPPAPRPVQRIPQPMPEPVVQPVPEPVQAPPDPRARAKESGLLALQDQLAQLRNLDTPTTKQPLSAGAATKTSVDRSVLSSNLGSGARGIEVVADGGKLASGSAALSGHSTAKVAPTASASPSAVVERSGASGQASRSREEIELVFDRNKAAIYAIYNRALRDNPALQGKIVLELTIAPGGEVTDCRVVSSDLGNPELESKLVARVKMFRFEARDVAVMTTTKPIEFFPA